MNREIIKKLILGDISLELKNKYLLNISSMEENIQMQNTLCKNSSIWPSPLLAESMIGYTCLQNIEFLLDDVILNKIPGDFIETGVWGGGACIYAKLLLNAHNHKMKVFVADSFAGLPAPELDRYPQDKGDLHHTCPELSISLEDVQSNFKKYNCLDKNVVFLKGWFKDTLLTLSNKQKFCIIRLDGDMYGSTMDSLINLYSKLSKGGYCIIDDYALANCARAVNDFRQINNITCPFKLIPGAGAGALYWKKDD